MIGNCYIVMWMLIISLVLLGVIALIAGIIRNKRLQKKIEKGELDRMPEVKEVDVECCGQHEVCERDSLLAAVSKKIEYYDDEELDQFIGKAGDAYTEEETEMFRDVLYTTLDVEVAGWVRSLQLRGIELPDDLKDEVFLIIGERRNIEVKRQMTGDVMDLLQYTFFQHALLGSLLASIACGIIGTYIVTRRLVFISGGITHASFGGIGLGLFAGISPILSAAVFSVLSAFGVEWLSRRKDMREDSAIAVFWTLGMALGIMFSFLSPGFAPDLSAYLFGNILTINQIDLWMLGILALILTGFFYLFIRPIVYIAFDREFARSQKIPVEIFEYVLMMFIALTIVACLRMVGIVLAISLLTIPQMTANLFTYSFKKIIWLSIGIGFLGCLGGLFISYHWKVPSGASIIFFSILIYAVCKIGKSCCRKKS